MVDTVGLVIELKWILKLKKRLTLKMVINLNFRYR